MVVKDEREVSSSLDPMNANALLQSIVTKSGDALCIEQMCCRMLRRKRLFDMATTPTLFEVEMRWEEHRNHAERAVIIGRGLFQVD
jgi:hypothetical protein